MATIRESRFHRMDPPATADKKQPPQYRIEPLKEEDLTDLAEFSKLPRIWG